VTDPVGSLTQTGSGKKQPPAVSVRSPCSARAPAHAADGADRITATTDVPNTLMAAAFDRANYFFAQRG
jgi:hypothetical protein